MCGGWDSNPRIPKERDLSSYLTGARLDLESRACSPISARLTRHRHPRDFPPPLTLLICVRGLLMLNCGHPARLPEEPVRGDLYDYVAVPRQHPEIGDDYPRVGVLTRLQEFVSYLALHFKCTIDKTHRPLNQLDVGRQEALHGRVEGFLRLSRELLDADENPLLEPRTFPLLPHYLLSKVHDDAPDLF